MIGSELELCKLNEYGERFKAVLKVTSTGCEFRLLVLKRPPGKNWEEFTDANDEEWKLFASAAALQLYRRN